MSIENLFRFVKSLSQLEAFPQVVYEPTDSLSAIHDDEATSADVSAKKFYYAVALSWRIN